MQRSVSRSHPLADMFLKLYLCSFVLNCGLVKDTSAQGLITNALFLGESENHNTSLADCVWKRSHDRASCPDPDIQIILYTNNSRPNTLNIKEGDWLRNSALDPDSDNIILIHGYAGGDNQLPTVVLRDAYLNHGGYNVFVVDWGALARTPCYVAAVHNLRPVANCIAQALSFLRDSGLRIDRTTCVGHSLGAHVCGNIANYLNFRLEKIIGLDPAKPLIKNSNPFRLDSGDAKAVQVVHTNAGRYGEGGRIGHVDFCINGGRRQPFCSGTTNENLCSHVWAVCYLAESIFDDTALEAEPCTRKCPAGPALTLRRGRDNNRYAVGNLIPLGHRTPNYAFGSFCLKDERVPFCPSAKRGYGDQRCCLQLPTPPPPSPPLPPSRKSESNNVI